MSAGMDAKTAIDTLLPFVDADALRAHLLGGEERDEDNYANLHRVMAELRAALAALDVPSSDAFCDLVLS